MFSPLGESVPASKVPISGSERETIFTVRGNNRSMLFCGTTLLQSRGVDGAPAKAMVIRTGKGKDSIYINIIIIERLLPYTRTL